MTNLRKAAQAVIDRWYNPDWKDGTHTDDYMDALRAALAEPEQEPDAVFFRCLGCRHEYQDHAPSSCDCLNDGGFERIEYFTHPAVPLNDEQIARAWAGSDHNASASVKRRITRAIEAELMGAKK